MAGEIQAPVDRKPCQKHIRTATSVIYSPGSAAALLEISPPPELLSVLRRIEARGHLENAHRALTNAGQVFMYAIATGRAERNPAADLKGAIPRPSVKHMSSIIDPDQVGELMRAIARYSGSPITRCALQLTAHVFLRSKEIRLAEWSEIDFDKQEWRIPIAKMKGNKRDQEANPAAYHLVPLATQVDRHPSGGPGFIRSREIPISRPPHQFKAHKRCHLDECPPAHGVQPGRIARSRPQGHSANIDTAGAWFR